MNTYHKFCPNVFLAKCDEKHEKGEVIEVTTKYGKENESIVFNLIFEKDGFYYSHSFAEPYSPVTTYLNISNLIFPDILLQRGIFY